MKLFFKGLTEGQVYIDLDGNGTYETYDLNDIQGGLDLDDNLDYSKIKVKANSKVFSNLQVIKNFEIQKIECNHELDENGQLDSSSGDKKKQLKITITVGSSYYSTNVSPSDLNAETSLYGGWNIDSIEGDVSDFVKEIDGSMCFQENIHFECDSPLVRIINNTHDLSIKYDPLDLDTIAGNQIQITLTPEISIGSSSGKPQFYYIWGHYYGETCLTFTRDLKVGDIVLTLGETDIYGETSVLRFDEITGIKSYDENGKVLSIEIRGIEWYLQNNSEGYPFNLGYIGKYGNYLGS